MEGAMTSWAWTGGSPSSMLQQAKEELEILEAQYPNRFGYLKLELKSFISLVDSQNMTNYNKVLCDNPTSSSTTTQASSTKMNRKKRSNDFEKVRRIVSNEKVECEGQCTKRKRVDEVMEKAQACLHKIQVFKTSFSC